MDNIFEYKDSYVKNKTCISHLLYGDVKNCLSPIISVIIPTYKRIDTLETAIQSAIHQDCSFEYEIIVVDNNPNPEDVDVLRLIEALNAKNVFYYKNAKNFGMIGNWNRGIELSRGKYITFCHDDDALLPNALSHLISVKSKIGRQCILARNNTMDAEGNVTFRYPFPQKRLKGLLVEKEYYNYSLYDQFIESQGYGVGCLYEKKHLIDIGGYNDSYYPSADYAMHCVYTKKFGCVVSNVPTFIYRIAINESSNVYKYFAIRDHFFRECMSLYIPIPSFILKKLNDALFRVNTIFFNRGWGHVMEYTPDKKDQLFISIMSTFHKLKSYSICLHIHK